MNETLADIEALALSCRSEQSRIYITESIQCYRAGAYRASIVTSWIAVVFDLIDKIRELSLAGDQVAKKLEEKHDTYLEQIASGNPQGIKAALEFEKEILETCKSELQFFDPQQLLDLKRLREDRNRCAHPSFQSIGLPYQPSAEQARLHLRNVIVHVLSQRPIQGKAALAELKTMISSEYFPVEERSALIQMKSSSFSNVSESMVKALIDMLIFAFLDKNDKLYYRRQVISALNAVCEMYPKQFEIRLRDTLNKVVIGVEDEQLSGVICLVANVSLAWSVLNDAGQDKVKNFIVTGPIKSVMPGMKSLGELPNLKTEIQTRIESLELDDLAEAISTYDLAEQAKERALVLLSKAASWGRANDLFARAVLPIIDILDRGDVERIIKMPSDTEADLPGSHGYEVFVNKIRKCNLIPEPELDKLLRENGASYLLPQMREL